MTDERIEGAFRKGAGHVRDAIGGLTGDEGMQARGKFDEAAGAAQDAMGQARERAQEVFDEVESFARSQPLTAVAAALGVGLALGLSLRGGKKTVYVRR